MTAKADDAFIRQAALAARWPTPAEPAFVRCRELIRKRVDKALGAQAGGSLVYSEQHRRFLIDLRVRVSVRVEKVFEDGNGQKCEGIVVMKFFIDPWADLTPQLNDAKRLVKEGTISRV